MFQSLFAKPLNLEQKRRHKRLPVRLNVICEVDGTGFNATVVDVGVVGLRVSVPRKLKSESVLKITYSPDAKRRNEPVLHGAPVSVQVKWCRLKKFSSTIEVGGIYVSKLEGTWVEHALNQFGLADSAERRRTVRASVNPDFILSLQLRTPGLEPLVGRVDNLCQGGALISVAYPLGLGCQVDITLGPYYSLKALRLKGEVTHQIAHPLPDTFQYGVTFQGTTRGQLGALIKYVEQLLKAQAET